MLIEVMCMFSMTLYLPKLTPPFKLCGLQHHHETDCPAYPVVCQKCNKDGIPRAKVNYKDMI